MAAGDVISDLFTTDGASFQPGAGVEIIITGIAGFSTNTTTVLGQQFDGTDIAHFTNGSNTGVRVAFGITNTNYLRMVATGPVDSGYTGIQIA